MSPPKRTTGARRIKELEDALSESRQTIFARNKECEHHKGRIAELESMYAQQSDHNQQLRRDGKTMQLSVTLLRGVLAQNGCMQIDENVACVPERANEYIGKLQRSIVALTLQAQSSAGGQAS